MGFQTINAVLSLVSAAFWFLVGAPRSSLWTLNWPAVIGVVVYLWLTAAIAKKVEATYGGEQPSERWRSVKVGYVIGSVALPFIVLMVVYGAKH
jgi:hypothetical protein